MGDPSACCPATPNDGLVYRRGKLRKREDDEVRMMREALAHLEDTQRVKRILLELGRFYNPVTDSPVLGLETRRAVLRCLDTGDHAAARELLDAHLADYLRMDTPPAETTAPSRGAP